MPKVEPNTGEVTYFGYGTLLGTSSMRAYCPTAQPISIANYPEHELTFTKYSENPPKGGCDVKAAPGARIVGVLFRLTMQEMADLDEASGVQYGWYERRPIKVILPNGESFQTSTYFVPHPLGGFSPATEYLEKVRDGARTAGLPNEYLEALGAILKRFES